MSNPQEVNVSLAQNKFVARDDMKSIRDLSLENSRLLIRCDFNAPLDSRGKIRDDFRVKKAVPTIQYAMERGAKCILISHLDRPGGKRVERLSLKRFAKTLEGFLGVRVAFLPNAVGKLAENKVKRLRPGEVVLLENLRFHEEEEENDPEFADRLARLGNLYVNDAFSVSHRKHASIVSLPHLLESGAGLLLEEELRVLGKLRERPERPFVVVVGGAKVETKGKFLAKMREKADRILVANLLARALQEKIGKQDTFFKGLVVPLDGVPGRGKEYDIGPKTLELFLEKIEGAKTILWTGPLGKVEQERYTKGSLALAQAILASGAFSVAGGGDLVAFLGAHGFRDRFHHASTGGGAMLAYVAGEELAGLSALNHDAH